MGPQCAAKQLRLPSKSNQLVFGLWCHFGGKSWYEFYLPMVVKLYVKTRCKYGEKVYMWIMMIGWHMFQVVKLSGYCDLIGKLMLKGE